MPRPTGSRASARRSATSGGADVLTRRAFPPVAEEFADGASAVRPETLVESTRAHVAESLSLGRDCLVTDALLPFVPSLVAWGHDETTLVQVVQDLTRAVEPAEIVVVYVHDDPATALRRAVAREGAGREEWYVAKLAGSTGTRSVHDRGSVADHLGFAAEPTRRLLAGTPWHVVTVDTGTLDARESFAQSRRRLTDLPEMPELLELPERPSPWRTGVASAFPPGRPAAPSAARPRRVPGGRPVAVSVVRARMETCRPPHSPRRSSAARTNSPA